MSRVINPESASKLRRQLMQSVSLALRQLVLLTELDDQGRDLAAYIALALDEIYQTVESSVAAWEKRGYWIKADRYRLEWTWAEQYGAAMRAAVLGGDWMGIGVTALKIAAKMSAVNVPARHRLGAPWEGAWQRLQATTQVR